MGKSKYCFCESPNKKHGDNFCRDCGGETPTENWCSDSECDGACDVSDDFCGKCGSETMLYQERNAFVQY